jgi:hypothetical protein
LIFSLIAATVGVVSIVGFQTLEERQTVERVNNVERAFDVFRSNMEDVYRDGAPSRATEIRLAGGTLRYGEPVTVTLANASDADRNITMELTPLVYADGETKIVYAGGAILRQEPSGSVLIADPPFVLGPERTLLQFVRTTRGVDRSAVSRTGTVRVESRRTDVVTAIGPGIADADRLNLTVDSPRGNAWGKYLQAHADRVAGWEYDDGSNTLTFETESISVPRFRIQIRFVA